MMHTTQTLKKAMRNTIYVLVVLSPVLFLPLCYNGYNPVKADAARILMGAVLLILIFHTTFQQESFTLKKSPLDFFFLLFLFLLSLSITQAVSTEAALERLSWFLCLFFVTLFTFQSIQDAQDARKLFMSVTFTGALVCIYGILRYAFTREEMLATFGYQNFLAQYLLFVLPCSAFLMLTETRKLVKTAFFLAAMMSFFVLLLTLVRGAWLGFFVSMLCVFPLFLLCRAKPLTRKDKLWFLSLFSCFIIMTFAASRTNLLSKSEPSEKPRVEKEFQEFADMDNASNASRIVFYKDTLRMLKDYPLLGVGIGNFEYVYPKYRTLTENVFTYDWRLTRAHNDYLQIAAEAGIPALFLFLLVLLVYLVKTLLFLRASPDAEKNLPVLALFTGITATLIQALVDFNFYNTVSSLHFFIFLGAGAALTQTETKLYRVTQKGRMLSYTLVPAGIFLILISLYSFGANFYTGLGDRALHASHIKSIGYYKKALSLQPRNRAALVKLGQISSTAGDYAEALTVLNKLLAYYPYEYQSYNFRGNMHFLLNRPEDAESDYKAALAIYNFSIPHFNLGLLSEAKGDMHHAMKEYREAISLNPNYGDAHFKLGMLYGSIGFHKKALESFQKASKTMPQSAEAKFNLGQAYAYTGKFSEAEKHLKEALEMEPQNAAYRNSLRKFREQKNTKK